MLPKVGAFEAVKPPKGEAEAAGIEFPPPNVDPPLPKEAAPDPNVGPLPKTEAAEAVAVGVPPKPGLPPNVGADPNAGAAPNPPEAADGEDGDTTPKPFEATPG
jgi:hypothetical protein